ncbi:hypothetical protein TcasGA2_TC016326 [Tribolium castaneum]|uniref:Uncharacterized protein n=1 Tax=Tribolium castaneum TaxID=7070 RepID=D7EKE6_TRICA|nr:hypothetical protein TcasGA2_TC016326 [Tribolium castaneum]
MVLEQRVNQKREPDEYRPRMSTDSECAPTQCCKLFGMYSY